MTLKEKTLYHQIHPLKLATDVGTAFISTYWMWEHNLVRALVVAFVPSVIVTVVLVRFGDLDGYRDSKFGQYFGKYMNSRVVDALRFSGFAVMLVGGWSQVPSLIVLGFLLVGSCWVRGLLFKGGIIR